MDRDEEKNRYAFEAPSAQGEETVNDETGAIVGALAACIIISAVLLFLWKMLQRKKTEMKELQKDVENTVTAREEIPTSRNPSKSKHTNFNKTRAQSSKREKVQLPNNALQTDNTFDSVDVESQEGEMILPPFSRISSSSWSQQDEMISADTGYNSGIGRKEKDGGLRRRYKQCSEELYMEHPRDIVDALKRDQQQIRNERLRRASKVNNAMEILKECQNVVNSARDKINVYSQKKRQALQSLRKSRRERNLFEMKRNRWKNSWNSEKQKSFDQKEAFVSTLEWFDGLRLHYSTRQVAEEVFLLRSLHRSAIERNELEKKAVSESHCCIRDCIKHVEKTKEKLRVWKRAMAGIEPEGQHFINPSTKIEKLIYEKPENIKQRIMLPRIFKNNAVRPSPVKEKSDKKDEKFCGNSCQQCHQSPCNCGLKNKEKVLISSNSCQADPFVHFSTNNRSIPIQLNTTEAISDFTNDSIQPGPSAYEIAARTSNFYHSSPKMHLLTLKLCRVFTPGLSSSEEDFSEISEREVQKVIQRVPSITALKSLRKENNNSWIVEAEASANRVANIRFNCRGRSYIIGMSQ